MRSVEAVYLSSSARRLHAKTSPSFPPSFESGWTQDLGTTALAIAAASLKCWKKSRPTVCVDVAPSPRVYIGSYGSRVSTDTSTTNRMLIHPSPHDVTCKEAKCRPTNFPKEKEPTITSEDFEPLKAEEMKWIDGDIGLSLSDNSRPSPRSI